MKVAAWYAVAWTLMWALRATKKANDLARQWFNRAFSRYMSAKEPTR